MSFEGWLMIGVVVYMLLAFTIVIFLGSIDVIDEDNGKIIFVCLAVPPIGLLLLIVYCFILFGDFCAKHKDKIRKFLQIK